MEAFSFFIFDFREILFGPVLFIHISILLLMFTFFKRDRADIFYSYLVFANLIFIGSVVTPSVELKDSSGQTYQRMNNRREVVVSNIVETTSKNRDLDGNFTKIHTETTYSIFCESKGKPIRSKECWDRVKGKSVEELILIRMGHELNGRKL